jgi:hypothetical protein
MAIVLRGCHTSIIHMRGYVFVFDLITLQNILHLFLSRIDLFAMF